MKTINNAKGQAIAFSNFLVPPYLISYHDYWIKQAVIMVCAILIIPIIMVFIVPHFQDTNSMRGFIWPFAIAIIAIVLLTLYQNWFVADLPRHSTPVKVRLVEIKVREPSSTVLNFGILMETAAEPIVIRNIILFADKGADLSLLLPEKIYSAYQFKISRGIIRTLVILDEAQFSALKQTMTI